MGARYSAPDYIFGEAPNYFLAKCKPLLPASGRVLATADGEGRNSIWLAEQGLEVHAIDFSPTAQDKARALAQERGSRTRYLAGITTPDTGRQVCTNRAMILHP